MALWVVCLCLMLSSVVISVRVPGSAFTSLVRTEYVTCYMQCCMCMDELSLKRYINTDVLNVVNMYFNQLCILMVEGMSVVVTVM